MAWAAAAFAVSQELSTYAQTLFTPAALYNTEAALIGNTVEPPKQRGPKPYEVSHHGNGKNVR
jgi:hypothetical protein